MLAELDDPERTVTRGWPDEVWRRLIEAVLDPEMVWTGLPTCPRCGRPLAEGDCEADSRLCWSGVTGLCH